MVSPGGVIAHRVPAQYQTVMVPQTVMVSPEGVQYQQIPAQYGVRNRVEMVSPGLQLRGSGRAALQHVWLVDSRLADLRLADSRLVS